MNSLLRSVSVLALGAVLASCSTLSVPGAGSMPKLPGSAAARGDVEGDMKLASAALAGGDQAGAIRILRRLAQDYPLAAGPRVKLGDALLAAGAPQEAARAYGGALSIEPRNFAALTGLGRVQLALRQPTEALKQFDEAARKAPADPLVKNGRAVALDQLGRHAEAQALYLSILRGDPSNLRVRSNYALSLALAGQHDEAADILAGLAAAPDAEPRIRQNLALVYGLEGNDGQAAHIARMDLDEDAVQNNLDFYQRLRTSEGGPAKGMGLTQPAKDGVRPAAPIAPATSGAPPAPVAPTRKQEEKKVERSAPARAMAGEASTHENVTPAPLVEVPEIETAATVPVAPIHLVPEGEIETDVAESAPRPRRAGLFARLFGKETEKANQEATPVVVAETAPARVPAVGAAAPHTKVEIADKPSPATSQKEAAPASADVFLVKDGKRPAVGPAPRQVPIKVEAKTVPKSVKGAELPQNENQGLASNLHQSLATTEVREPAVPAVL